MVEKLQNVNLREIWGHEAKDFTTWLFNNIDYLSEQIGFELFPLEREKSTGVYFVDIFAKDGNDNRIVIENQLEKTNHEHIGKLLTYFVNLDAKKGIWISPDPRPEHIKTINFLNEMAPDDIQFFLIKADAFKIGNSPPAISFSILAGPSKEISDSGKIKKDLAKKHKQEKYDFFKEIIELSNSKNDIFKRISPQGYQNWIETSNGVYKWQYQILSNTSLVCLKIKTNDPKSAQSYYNHLHNQKESIEKEFGEELKWDFKERRMQHYIFSQTPIDGLNDRRKWKDIQKDMVERMDKLYKVINKFAQKETTTKR